MARAGDEIADLVDENDRVAGTATRGEIRAGGLLHRGVAVACRNDSGDIYVHRRTRTKDIYPGLYDMFVAGMVASGETYSEAATREVAEELGIRGPRPVPLFKHLYAGADNPHWVEVFEISWNGRIEQQPSEVAWGAFLSLQELDRKLGTWPFVPDGMEIYPLYRAARP